MIPRRLLPSLPAWFWILVLVDLVAAVALTFAARHAPPFPGDLAIARAIQASPVLEAAAPLLQLVNDLLAGGSVVVLVAVVVAVFLLLRRWDLAIIFAGANLLRIGSTLLKWLTDRPRPSAALVRVSEWPSDPSFPSGHVFGAVLCFGSLALIVEALVLPVALRRAIQLLAALIIALTGVARVYTGAHWPSDVLGSLLWTFPILAAIGVLPSPARTSS
jgi:membrane-associated phospholipid phosphatase